MTNSAYSLLNQIFYATNKFDVDNLHELEKYFYNKGTYGSPMTPPFVVLSSTETINTQPIVETKQKIVTTIVEPMHSNVVQNEISDLFVEKESSIHPPRTSKPTNASGWFEPKHSDSIFWCIYYHVYGAREYEQIGSRFGNKILAEKHKIMEHFNKSPKQLKSSNVRFTNDRMKEVISEFACAKNCSSFLETAAYAIYYNLTIYFVDDVKKTYMVFKNADSDVVDEVLVDEVLDQRGESGPDSTKICIIYRNHVGTKGRYRTMRDVVDVTKSVCEIKQTHLKLEQFDKPLKAVSNYKVAELDEIAQKIGLHVEPKTKKGDLYNLLAEKVAWV